VEPPESREDEAGVLADSLPLDASVWPVREGFDFNQKRHKMMKKDTAMANGIKVDRGFGFALTNSDRSTTKSAHGVRRKR